MRSLLRGLPRILGVVVVLQLVFFALLVLGAAFPDRPVVERLSADARSGAYGPSGEPDGQGGRATSFTDCVAAGTGLGAPGLSTFDRALRMPRLGSCEQGAGQLARLERGDPPGRRLEYFRYWAGYTVLTRPVLAAGGMDGMRLVAGGIFGVALMAMVLALSRTTGVRYTLALTVPLLVSSNVLSVPATAFSHALSLAATFSGVACVAVASRYGAQPVLVAVAVSACVFNFVDLLTTPAMPWALSAAVAATTAFTRTRRIGDACQLGIVASGVWIASYALTWVSRWVITALFLGWGRVLDVVLGIARFRVDGDYGEVSHRFGAAVLRNGRTWLAVPVTPELVLVVATLCALGSLALAWRRFGATQLVVAAVLAAPALIAPVWMLVLSNHSQIHDVFVYRTVPVSVGIAVGACLVAARTGRTTDRGWVSWSSGR